LQLIFGQKSGGNSAKMFEIRPFLGWAKISAKEGRKKLLLCRFRRFCSALYVFGYFSNIRIFDPNNRIFDRIFELVFIFEYRIFERFYIRIFEYSIPSLLLTIDRSVVEKLNETVT
jgi:hypothetical protein